MGDFVRLALWLVCVAAAAGCSPGTSTPLGGGGGTGTGSGKGAGDVDGGGAGKGETVCGFEFSGMCATCVEEICCSEWDACAANSACNTLDQCLIACETNDCLQSCSNASTMDTVNLYNQAADCLQSQCTAPCYGDAGVGDGGSLPDSTVGTSDSGHGKLSGCAYSQCPASITCGSSEGSNGPYALGCIDGEPLLSTQRSPAVCVEAFETGPPGFLTFPETYTCNSAQILCNWPEGSISCPVMWIVPSSGGGTALNGGCCGFLVSTDTSPKCGLSGLDQSTGLQTCFAPGPNDMAE